MSPAEDWIRANWKLELTWRGTVWTEEFIAFDSPPTATLGQVDDCLAASFIHPGIMSNPDFGLFFFGNMVLPYYMK